MNPYVPNLTHHRQHTKDKAIAIYFNDPAALRRSSHLKRNNHIKRQTPLGVISQAGGHRRPTETTRSHFRRLDAGKEGILGRKMEMGCINTYADDNVETCQTAKVNKAKSASGWNIKLTLEVAHLLLRRFYIFISVSVRALGGGAETTRWRHTEQRARIINDSSSGAPYEILYPGSSPFINLPRNQKSINHKQTRIFYRRSIFQQDVIEIMEIELRHTHTQQFRPEF
ncbi:hypothetical protein TcasGA2_TC007918 [Tribolium castaneum]|uniref:Uncharacterized protein n=1 Tax=Tribolium castaneum TaxID=7070 RepID=D2A317_TRICA|nr:hypothetical protein TcasGA2_TC007918 [Tribolium castaneum]